MDTSAADAREESGWKLVSGDVFRAPASSAALCVHVGSGVQIMAACLVTLVLASLGFLSPASRGALLTTGMVLYVLLSGTAGLSAVWLWGLMERSYEGWMGVCAKASARGIAPHAARRAPPPPPPYTQPPSAAASFVTRRRRACESPPLLLTS